MQYKKLKMFHFQTVRRIDDKAHDSEEVLCNKLKNSSFSIQVNESTDLTNKCHVLAFVRFVNEGEIQKKNFLCCKELPETNKGIDAYYIRLTKQAVATVSTNKVIIKGNSHKYTLFGST